MREDSPAVADCDAIIAHHSKSFSLASRLLGADERRAAVIVYAWCRRADDRIDHARQDELELALADLHREIHQIDALLQATKVEAPNGAETPVVRPMSDPILQLFAQVVRERRIPLHYPSELIEGMKMDAKHSGFSTLDELLLYCYRVAGVVGLMMCHVLGVRAEDALQHAVHLGMAMQLTNICRDVDEDWRRGRLYLPLELLGPNPPSVTAAQQIGSPSGFPRSHSAQASRAVQSLLELADKYYQSGDAGLEYLSRPSARAIRTARLVYSAIGDRIRRKAYNVHAGRAIVPTSTKVGLALRAAFDTMRLPSVPQALRPPSVVLRFEDVHRFA